MSENRLFYLRAVTPAHVGSGNDLGVIDLPIQREKHTNFPKFEGSSLKGSIRSAFEKKLDSEKEKILTEKIKQKSGAQLDLNLELLDEELRKSKQKTFDHALNLIFGYDEQAGVEKKYFETTEFAGAVSISDARLLFFPVKSPKGVYALITSPYILKRFINDLELVSDGDSAEGITQLSNIDYGTAMVFSAEGHLNRINNQIILEEYTFNCSEETINHGILSGFPDEILKRAVILSDDDFSDFVNNHTEVITRIKIDDNTGTVDEGALFNEEYLPAESLLYFMVFANPVYQEKKRGIFGNEGYKDAESVMNFFVNSFPDYFQIGGNQTLGKGIMQKLSFKSQKESTNA